MSDVRWSHSPMVVMSATYLSMAVPLGLFGAAWPQARHEFGRSSGSLGLLALAYGLGRLSTSATAMSILRRTHIRRAVGVLCGALAVVDLVAAFTRTFAVLVVGMALIGAFTGALDSLGARFQTVLRSVASAGVMFGCYGIGATLGPAVAALTSWTVGFAVAGAVTLVSAALALRHAVVWPEGLSEPRRNHPGVESPAAQVPAVAMAVSLCVFAIYCGIEAMTGNWSATYLEESRHASPAAAGLAVSGFWAGMTIGRLMLGRLPWPARRILISGGVTVLVAVMAIPVVPTSVAILAVVVTGVALAGIYPTLMSTTADRVGAAAAGRVSGWQLLVANLAATGLSSLIGLLVRDAGAGAVIVVVIATAAAGLPVLMWSTALHAGTDPGTELNSGADGRPGDAPTRRTRSTT